MLSTPRLQSTCGPRLQSTFVLPFTCSIGPLFPFHVNCSRCSTFRPSLHVYCGLCLHSHMSCFHPYVRLFLLIYVCLPSCPSIPLTCADGDLFTPIDRFNMCGWRAGDKMLTFFSVGFTTSVSFTSSAPLQLAPDYHCAGRCGQHVQVPTGRVFCESALLQLVKAL